LVTRGSLPLPVVSIVSYLSLALLFSISLLEGFPFNNCKTPNNTSKWIGRVIKRVQGNDIAEQG
jgi:hypothetical protein